MNMKNYESGRLLKKRFDRNLRKVGFNRLGVLVEKWNLLRRLPEVTAFAGAKLLNSVRGLHS